MNQPIRQDDPGHVIESTVQLLTQFPADVQRDILHEVRSQLIGDYQIRKDDLLSTAKSLEECIAILRDQPRHPEKTSMDSASQILEQKRYGI